MKEKYKPLRMCVVCGKMLPKEELVRLTGKREGKIIFESRENTAGKGIYVCKNVNCLDEFTKGRKFRRRFHPHLSPETLQQLLEYTDKLKEQ
jgi:uncharacterized protein